MPDVLKGMGAEGTEIWVWKQNGSHSWTLTFPHFWVPLCRHSVGASVLGFGYTMHELTAFFHVETLHDINPSLVV